MVSLLEGLDWPSTRGGLIDVSFEVTSKLLLTTWNSCLQSRIDFSRCQDLDGYSIDEPV